MADSSIKVSSLDFDKIKQDLRDYLKAKDEFKDFDFEGSALSTLVDVLAYNTYQNGMYLNFALGESFLESAQLRSNVVSRAKELGYTPASAQGSVADLTLTFSNSIGNTQIIVPSNTEFSTTLDDINYTFYSNSEVIVSADESGAFKTDLKVYEGDFVEERFTVNTVDGTTYKLSNKNVNTKTVEVAAQVSTSNTTQYRYVAADQIYPLTSTSNVFFIQEGDNQQYEVTFGDNVVSAQPLDNNVLIVTYRTTDGSATNGATTFTGPSKIGGHGDYTVALKAAAAGGAEQETTESVRKNATNFYLAQGRAVTERDYSTYILAKNTDVESVSVWGGEENSPQQFGYVFISAKPKNGLVLSDAKTSELRKQLDDIRTVTSTLEFVDPTYLYIVPTTKVLYDSTKTTKSGSVLFSEISTAIRNFESNQLSRFENVYRNYKFLQTIDAVDDSIYDIDVDVRIAKRNTVSTTTATTYNISFNNPLETTLSSNIDSTEFTYNGKLCKLDDDGNGNVRIYFVNKGVKQVLNATAGTVDYGSGLVVLNSFLPTSFVGTYLEVSAVPAESQVVPRRNQILLITDATLSLEDSNDILKETVTGAVTTTGSTAVISSGGSTSVF